MPLRSFLIFFFCFLYVCCAFAHSSMRLVELNGKRVWMEEQEVVRIVTNGQNLFDITDHPHLQPNSNMWKPTIPTQCSHQDLVNGLVTFLEADNLFNTISTLSSYHTRYYESQTAVEAAEWLYSQYQKIITNSKSDAQVKFFNNTWAQPSIIARIPAQPGSAHADEVVILGGHIDSIIKDQSIIPPYPRSPGADDDGSGSSNVLEVFRVLVENNFHGLRTIEFHGYSAEEVGLRGSQAIAESYQSQGIKVAGMLQLDMTAYPNMTSPMLRMINDYTNEDLMNFLKVVASTYSKVAWYDSECGYPCSDHASWNKTGFYTCRVKENGNYQQIHSVQDVLSNLWLPYSIEFCKVSLGFLVEMSLDV